jgi:hypothetical protein
VEQEPVNEQNVQMEADQIVDPPPPKQLRTISVQAGNGEDIIDNYLNTPQVSPRHICIIVKNKNKNYYYYFPILPKFTIRNVNRICLYTEPQGGRRTRDSVICCEASFAMYTC